jgi:putative membrane protein
MTAHRRYTELSITDALAAERTVLAAERTFLAYVRTALAMLITGLTGSRLTTDRVLFLSSLLLVVGSALVLAVGWWRLRGAQQALRSVITR